MREIVLMLLVALSIPFVFKRPVLGIAIYIGANVIRPEMLFWGGGRGSYVFMLYYALIVVASFCKGYLGNLRQVINRQFLQMIWLIFAIWVSIMLSQYFAFRDTYFAIELLKGFGICAFIYMVVNEFDEIRKIQNVLLGCFAFLGVWGIEQQFRGNERLEGLGGSAWGDSNGVAAVFVLFLPVALAKATGSKSRREFWVSAGIVAIMVSLIVCTKSRGGLLGLVAAVVAFGYYSRSMRRIALAALLMAVVALPFAGQAYLDRMKTMEGVSDSENLEGSAKSRLILWQAGLMVFSDNPLFGTGFLTYPEAKMKYEDRFLYLDEVFRKYVFRTEAKKVTHNSYIQVMSECGLFGAIPFFLLVTGGILSGFRARRLLNKFPEKSLQLKWLSGLCAGITGFAVCIFFIDAVLEIFLYFQLAFIGILLKTIASRSGWGQPEVSAVLTTEGNYP